MKKILILTLILTLLFTFTVIVNAQEEEQSETEITVDKEQTETEITGDYEPFPEGMGEQYVYFQYGADYNFSTKHFGGHYGFAHYFKDGLSFNGEIGGLGIFQESRGGDDTAGFNALVLLRWHFIREENFSIYMDGGAGVLVTTEPVPPGTRQWNFTPQAGIGASIKVSDDNRIIFGSRYHHISNLGQYNNPGRDSVIFYMGVTWPWGED